MCFALLMLNVAQMEPDMNLIKFFITVLLLVFSSQSLALFMPADSKVNTDETAVSNNVGC